MTLQTFLKCIWCQVLRSFVLLRTPGNVTWNVNELCALAVDCINPMSLQHFMVLHSPYPQGSVTCNTRSCQSSCHSGAALPLLSTFKNLLHFKFVVDPEVDSHP
jgi:hypothetical protein